MNKPKDTDLREAMRRMYADTPQLPSDFMERMHQAQEKENKRRTLRRWLYPISIGAVAASLLLLLLFNHVGDQPKEQPLVAKQKTEATQPINVKEEPQPTVEDTQTATEAVEIFELSAAFPAVRFVWAAAALSAWNSKAENMIAAKNSRAIPARIVRARICFVVSIGCMPQFYQSLFGLYRQMRSGCLSLAH